MLREVSLNRQGVKQNRDVESLPQSYVDRTSEFSEEQIYVLDTVGLYHYKGFLSAEEVAHANRVLDQWIGRAERPPSKFGFFDKDYLFCNIIGRNWLVDACRKTVGKWYRLDHCVGIQQPGEIQSAKTGRWVDQGYTLGNIHGGQFASQGSVFFNTIADQVFSGHMTFGISLIGQGPKDGGFCFIPGSHKQKTIKDGSKIFKEILSGNYESQCIYCPNLEPGDAVFFPENLMHGMKPLRAGYKRRAIYYKFVPGYIAWRSYDEVSYYSNLAKTDLERRIMRPPAVASFNDDTPNMSDNTYKEPV